MPAGTATMSMAALLGAEASRGLPGTDLALVAGTGCRI